VAPRVVAAATLPAAVAAVTANTSRLEIMATP
jgi:hypothetical protein